jgi:predicted nucleic acid-binding protein
MILLDSNVVIDVFDKKSPFHKWASRVLISAVTAKGPGAVINPVALAECLQQVTDPKQAIRELLSLGIETIDLPHQCADIAAGAYAAYLQNRKASGLPLPLSRMPLPDFFIGAHAQYSGYVVATRDIQRFGVYFPKVDLLKP